MPTIKRKLITILKTAMRFPIQLYYRIAGSKLQCNVCGYQCNRFMSDDWLPYSICPSCRSYIRHRLVWAVFDNIPGFSKEDLLQDKTILHFAPEPCLQSRLKKISKGYKCADLLTEEYAYDHLDYQMGLENMSDIATGSLDCLIALEVLEHLSDDKKGLKEINRVLKKGGWCILSVPQVDGREFTDEDPAVTDPAERTARFGQWDHYRIYGSDFMRRVEDAGFKASVFNYKSFEASLVERHVLLPPVLSSHPLATNYQKIYFGKKI